MFGLEHKVEHINAKFEELLIDNLRADIVFLNPKISSKKTEFFGMFNCNID